MENSANDKYVHALGYSWLTPCYDAVVGLTTREKIFKHALIRQARLAPEHIILDLACGTGTLTIWAKQSENSGRFTGVDGDEKILQLAREKTCRANLDIRYDHALSTHLPYDDAVYDRVISSLFFHHLDWQSKIASAQEMYRVLKPGGEIHIADWGRPANRMMRLLFYLIQLLDGFENTQPNVDGKLIEVFEQAGFSSVTCEEHFNTIFGTMSLYRAEKRT